MTARTVIPFAKMHGAGNDLVVIDCLAGDPVADWAAFARFALDRRLGIGGDQLLLVKPSRDADFFMGIRNADGSSAEMCANGIRAFTKYVRDRGLTTKDVIRVETLAGVVTPRWLGNDQVEVEMTRPVLEPAKIPTRLPGAAPLVDVPLEVDGDAPARLLGRHGQPALRDLRRRSGVVSRSNGSVRGSSTTRCSRSA